MADVIESKVESISSSVSEDSVVVTLEDAIGRVESGDTVASPSPGIPVPVNVHNTQIQYVRQDNTTVSNIFREEHKTKTEFFRKFGLEVFLNCIEPERFMRFAKAWMFIGAAWALFHLSFDQLKEAIRLLIELKK